MTEDERIIEEIRRSRWRMSEECGHDVHRYIEHVKRFNDRYAAEVDAFRQLRGASARNSVTH
ncbi:MAG TPA: hypothetical protein HPP83_05190 [Candidatus Hydrogenedentes bacterium]|nr:hypothetical protein [Candidatus Hydrogenedentota bacterium]